MIILCLKYDHLGGVTTITNASGAIVQELSYDAWGNLVEWKTESGKRKTFHPPLSTFHLYLYDPVMCCFLSVDTYVQDPGNPQNFNQYAYCLNNPLRYVDLDGEWFLTGLQEHFDAAAYHLKYLPIHLP